MASRTIIWIIVALAVMGSVSYPLPIEGSALAQGAGIHESTFKKSPLDSDRCKLLNEQFNRLRSSGRSISTSAVDAASEGADLCRTGHFAAGADELAYAILGAGETPERPPSHLRMH